MESMDAARIWKKHEGTLSGNDLNAVLPAECDGFLADGALARGTVHPYLADAGFRTIEDDLVSSR